jgi:hypothetical protein
MRSSKGGRASEVEGEARPATAALRHPSGEISRERVTSGHWGVRRSRRTELKWGSKRWRMEEKEGRTRGEQNKGRVRDRTRSAHLCNGS